MCGCNKKAAGKRQPIVRNLGIQSATSQGQAPGGSPPAQMRALNAQTAAAPKSANQLSADRLKIEKIRRQAIQKAFNK